MYDLERSLHLLAGLHACHLKGPEYHDELGAKIRQAFKATEQAVRDNGDWTLAWTWVDAPNPRPTKFERGLAHPAEFSAGISYLRELQTLDTYHQGILGSGSNSSGARPRVGGPPKGPSPATANSKGGRGGKSSSKGGKKGADSAGSDGAPQGQ